VTAVATDVEPPQLWPIFICYRRVDGSAVARRLHEMLDKWETTGPEGTPVQLDVYLDETMPGVADWHELHRPYLEKARALVLVCTPAARIDEGPEDWVHREIDWWLGHRVSAPILVDALKQGIRYVPEQVVRRWPDIQRIAVVEEEWRALSGAALEEKTAAVRRQVIGALLPSGAAIYAQELEAERRRAQRLRRALVAAVTLLGATTLAGGYAYLKRQAALRSERAAGASLLDTRAAGLFAQSRLVDARQQVEMIRRSDLLARLSAPDDPEAAGEGDPPVPAAPPLGGRSDNLRHELAQLDHDLRGLRSEASQLRSAGRELLERANGAWAALGGRPNGVVAPDPPHVLSVELINAGAGESILVHYGTPDEVRLLMINGGPRASYRQFVERRLEELKDRRLDGEPVPIELFVVGDRDADKIDGLLRLLEQVRDAADPRARLVDIRGIWANLFRVDGGRGTRSRLRALIDELQVPLNEPFDHLLMRPERGRAAVTLAGGLEVVVVGPARGRVHDLYELSQREALRSGGAIEGWREEAFTRVAVGTEAAALSRPRRPAAPGCRPSENARRAAGGAYLDESVANLASTVLLFRYRGLTFLHTGDARGDLILEGLEAAGLLDGDGPAHVDLMSIPHAGSDRNVTVEFFERVQADRYLFSGDGRHGNPEIATVAALVTARGCDRYQMYFVNRDGPDDAHGARLDAFFHEELAYEPSYRRIFRSPERGSVVIDLLDPVRD
jgi:hypothetical protein